MKKVSELKSILSQYFPWNKARLDYFVKMLLALFMTRTVNLSELAIALRSKAEVASRYKRLQRFLSHHTLRYDEISKHHVQLSN